MTAATVQDDGAQLMVGLEIHVELATRTKMFTAAPNVAHPDYDDADPNTLTDPLVLGMPGVLPVVNRAAVEMSILVGLALNCRIARVTKWDRKSYYYPDLPKNYQISQYDQPICEEGYLDIPVEGGDGAATRRVRILRAHLEEDAGKLMHEAPGGAAIDHSIVDLNRAGTPLLEIVTYPDLTSADEAVTFCTMLRDICRTLGVTEGIMQKGHMRFEPNINVIITRGGATYRTPIAEIKNLNSFRAVRGAIEHEYHRQIEAWESTGQVMGSGSKSTRGWDDVRMVTTLQREKEEAHDYRYFPDPDLVPLEIAPEWVEAVRGRLVELPAAKQARYAAAGLDAKVVRALLDEPRVAAFYDQTVAAGVEPRRAAAFLLNTGAKLANDRGVLLSDLGVTPATVQQIIALADADQISSSAAERLFALCSEHPGRDAKELAGEHGLLQVSDTGALEGYVAAVLEDPKNQRIVEDIRGGKDKAIGALMGQVMKLSRGQANPKLVGEMIKAKITGA